MKTLFNTLRQFATLFAAVVLFLTIIPSTCNAQTPPPTDKQVASAINTKSGQEDLFHQANQIVHQGKWDEAIEIMRNLVKYVPDDDRYHECLGCSLAGRVADGKSPDQKADLLEAIVHFKTTIKLNPDREKDPRFLLIFSSCLGELGQIDEAKRYADRGIQLAPVGKIKDQLLGLRAKL